MKFSQKIVLFLIGFLYAVVLCSCDPAKRISRIVKRNPGLVKTDTVWKTFTDTIPAIDVKTSFEVNKDVSGVDSLFMLLNGKVDSLTKSRLLASTKNYIINRPLIQDSLIKVVDGITVIIYDLDGRIGVSIKKPPVIKARKIPIQTNSIHVAKALTWNEKIKIFMFDNWWWMLAIAWIAWKLFGSAIKTAINLYLPWLSFLFK